MKPLPFALILFVICAECLDATKSGVHRRFPRHFSATKDKNSDKNLDKEPYIQKGFENVGKEKEETLLDDEDVYNRQLGNIKPRFVRFGGSHLSKNEILNKEWERENEEEYSGSGDESLEGDKFGYRYIAVDEKEKNHEVSKTRKSPHDFVFM